MCMWVCTSMCRCVCVCVCVDREESGVRQELWCEVNSSSKV